MLQEAKRAADTAPRRVRARRQGPPRGGRGALRAQPGQGRPGRRRLRDDAGPPPRAVRARLHREDEGQRAAARRRHPARRAAAARGREAARRQPTASPSAPWTRPQRRADDIIAEAKAQAERIRGESERELSAATQRRDSINSQLTNVRQMLATLTGASLPDPLGDDARRPADQAGAKAARRRRATPASGTAGDATDAEDAPDGARPRADRRTSKAAATATDAAARPNVGRGREALASQALRRWQSRGAGGRPRR